jgi:glutamate-5-semialdehyde dehydrogenase
MDGQLSALQAGMLVPYGGDRVAIVDDALATAFAPGDRLYVVQDSGAMLHIPAAVVAEVAESVSVAHQAFTALRSVPRAKVQEFYVKCAELLATSADLIAAANAVDMSRAEDLGRSTTRLELTERMQADMVSGLLEWSRLLGAELADPEHDLVERVDHGDWNVEIRRAPLGVIGFVFEGRPNVVVDAAGVLATGNTAVLRIGGDALGTAQAIVEHAIEPALAAAGLPEGALSLVPVRDRSAGWALFSDPRLALAVVRGSGPAVTQLSSVARQAGVPVSAHGTGGAWVMAGADTDASRFAGVIRHSLDRKVCNTVNTVAIVRERAAELVPVLLAAADEAAATRDSVARIHVADGSQEWVEAGEFDRTIDVLRPGGAVAEPRASLLGGDKLGVEWEWEDTPEISLVVVDDLDQAADLFNAYSPQFVVSLVSLDAAQQAWFRDRVNAPFVGDGFTRWVDGQYALNQPELGLSNWERGRLLGRAGVLSGADLTTRRMFAHHDDPGQHR